MGEARAATTADLDRLIVLLDQAERATPEHRGGWLFGHPERQFTPKDRLLSALDEANACVFTGIFAGYIAGVSIMTIETVAVDGPVGVIEELWVEPEYRQVGIGEALLDSAVAWCRAKGCVGVDIAALPGDRASKNLCERSGFVARMIVMHRPL